MKFREFLKSNIVFADGGTGTMLQRLCPDCGNMLSELYNIERPEAVSLVHAQYFEAGSNYVVTNTFGANSLKYDDATLKKIINAAVKNAKAALRASNAAQEKFVALDIGPTGKLLKPFGDLNFEDAISVFRKTAEIGAKAGVDFISIETFTDLYETKAAIIGCKEACDLPIVVTNAYSENGKLLTGATPRAVIATLEGLGVDAIGINCSFGPRESVSIIDEYIKYASIPVVFKPNAGLPDQNGNYDVKPEDFAEIMLKTAEKGVSVMGGCCGTTPAFIRALKKTLKPYDITRKQLSRAIISSGQNTLKIGDGFCVIGERLNPTGKKKLKEALLACDLDYITEEGESQVESGADALDVNVGLPGLDEPEMMEKVITELQKSFFLPLQIDTTDKAALERGLRCYNGKPLINSVNGKKESMDVVFPLAQKYGGVIVCLLLDEQGIPDNASDRIEIADKIIAEALKYGISTDELIFDPLCLSIATDKNAAKVTLECVKRLSERGLHTILGVSNVSFGLPERQKINATFLELAKQNGLTAAIINPKMDLTYDKYAENALLGKDENFEQYIEYASKEISIKSNIEAETKTLSQSIIKGHKNEAGNITAELLKTKTTLEIINNEIIPALNIVGENYEKNIIFLPQLLSSAEAAGEAFNIIKKVNAENNQNSVFKAKFVIATVKGDIHDIGKNIVKMLLENYGYDVIDLGKDVPKEKILEALYESKAKFLGLSALMTTTLCSMKETIELVKEKLPEVKIVVGGAVLTEEYAMQIGADKYSKDAMETVNYAEAN